MGHPFNMNFIFEKILIAYKYIASFRKKTWVLEDYPIRFRYQGDRVLPGNEWLAQILNWGVVSGLGKTREEAYRELKLSYETIKESQGMSPRPGTFVPIEFCSVDEIEGEWDIVSLIIEDVLLLDSENVFLTDESSLWHFVESDPNCDHTLEEYFHKIKNRFGVDVSHIEDGNFVEISKFIRVASSNY